MKFYTLLTVPLQQRLTMESLFMRQMHHNSATQSSDFQSANEVSVTSFQTLDIWRWAWDVEPFTARGLPVANRKDAQWQSF